MTEEDIIIQFNNEATRDVAFRQLVHQYQQKLYFHIRRMVICHDDANDVLQNTLIKIWHNLANFRAESKLYTWLYRIATNECLSFLQQKQRKFAHSFDDMTNHLSNQLKADTYFEGDKIQLQLQQAILKLPEKQRLVFNLRYYDEMPYEEMSQVLGTSEGALKASYHHAVKKIEQFVTEK